MGLLLCIDCGGEVVVFDGVYFEILWYGDLVYVEIEGIVGLGDDGGNCVFECVELGVFVGYWIEVIKV